MLAALPAFAVPPAVHVLDDFSEASAWQAEHSSDTSATLHAEDGALCLDFDFNGVAGYVGLRRTLPLTFEGNYALSVRVRGKAQPQTLQLKLVDASGDNVWWYRKTDFQASRDWQTVRAERGDIDFAWGPTDDQHLRRTQSVELVLAAGSGGQGKVCFDDLKLQPLPPPRTSWPVPGASASSAQPGHAAGAAVDDNRESAWHSDPGTGPAQSLTLDFGGSRPFGGLVLHWLPGQQASRYDVSVSDDGQHWKRLRRVRHGNGGADPLLLTHARARFLRLDLHDGPARSYALAGIDVKDRAWGATPNAFFERLAEQVRRGLYPRGFSGQQSYWTLVGVDGGGAHAALMSEDGALEVGKGGFSVEPFLLAGGKLLSWADVDSTQALVDDYLPMPSVTWSAPGVRLRSSAFASGEPGDGLLLASYTVTNTTDHARTITLALAVRPFQVNPPTQFLNTPGGVSPIHELAGNAREVAVNGKPRLFPLATPDAFVASSFDAGGIVARLAAGDKPQATHVRDDFGYASGALLYRLHLDAHASRTVRWLAPLAATAEVPADARAHPRAWASRERERVAAQWHARLDTVTFQVPPAAKTLVDTLRSSLAWILMSRDGPALQPGTRSYARAWIRDGAMMSEGLLRLGHADVVRDFITWYAPYQFTSGKVPCCVDTRGAGAVPENDSHGELVFTIAELYRFTHDRATLATLWPHVRRAVAYMDKLRASQRTAANRTPATRANYGLMPASISHEGYSAKPMHSYWDDFWSLVGYDDAIDMARALDKPKEATRITASRDQFRDDLYTSLRVATRRHHIDYLPGSAELGDFDPTSTTIALAPGRQLAHMPPDLLHLLRNTFERYWQWFKARRDGEREWTDYTPYELRNIGAFVRLGWRRRVPALLDFYMADRRPPAWNGWAEVVRRDPRQPGFVGDMPHAWIASDYLRAVLDMFAWRRGTDQALVLAAGVPVSWLDGDGITIHGLRTPHGKVGYSLRRDGDRLILQLDAEQAPPGGFVLPWPYPGTPGAARIDGHAASWHDDELRIRSPHARAVINVPR